MAYRVYKYACRRPVAGEAAAVEQMQLRVRLWNALVEVEQQHSAAIESVLADLAPGADAGCRPPYACSEHAEEWQRRRPPACFQPCPEQQAEMSAWKATRRAAFRQEAVKAYLAMLELARKTAVKAVQAAHAALGLWWGNYDDVVKSYTVARRRPGELRFHSWYRVTGKVSVRYQTGLPLETAYAETDTRFQLRPMPDGYTWTTSRDKRLARTAARVRIGSDGRAPRWLELQLTQHRPIPAGSIIRQVAVTRELIGNQPRWWLIIVVDEPEVIRAVPAGPTIAVNLGWRVRPDGLRVAFWRTSQGQDGEVVLPNAWRDHLRKTEAIQADRSTAFNVARDRLVGWLASTTPLPAWLSEATENLPLWRSSERLARLVRRWADERFAGDETIYAPLAAWRTRERHLQEYASHARDQLLATRLMQYRRVAATLVRQAGQIRLHAFDLRPIAALGPEGHGSDLPAAVRRNRQQAAVSLLRLALVNACQREGVPLLVIPEGERITQTCWACRTSQNFDAAVHLEWTCTSCGERWDQDRNATRVMLQWQPQPGTPAEKEEGLRAVDDTDAAAEQQEDEDRAIS